MNLLPNRATDDWVDPEALDYQAAAMAGARLVVVVAAAILAPFVKWAPGPGALVTHPSLHYWPDPGINGQGGVSYTARVGPIYFSKSIDMTNNKWLENNPRKQKCKIDYWENSEQVRIQNENKHPQTTTLFSKI